jgi:hypothetical protein
VGRHRVHNTPPPPTTTTITTTNARQRCLGDSAVQWLRRTAYIENTAIATFPPLLLLLPIFLLLSSSSPSSSSR